RSAHSVSPAKYHPDSALIRPAAGVCRPALRFLSVATSDRARSGMTRRLRIAGTAFGALLVPACAGFQPDAPAPRPISALPAPVTPVGYRPMPGALATQAAKPRVVEKFAEGRVDT